MLRFGFILLVATSALAAPGYSNNVGVTLVEVGKNNIVKNTGRAVDLTDWLSLRRDNAEVSINQITSSYITNDIAALKNKRAQAQALAVAFVTSLAQATGVPGDVCIAAALIDAYKTGNYAQALRNFINHIARNVNLLVNLKRNPEAARFAVGPRSGCIGGGRVYEFEYAWDSIIANASPSTLSLLNEQYCTAKRLYDGFTVESNNVGALVTAASLPPVADIFVRSYGPLSKFVEALIENKNIDQCAQNVQVALARKA